MVVVGCCFFISCNQQPTPSAVLADEQQLLRDSMELLVGNIDSLMRSADAHRASGDREQEMATLAALGHAYQAEHRYGDAVKAHEQQLRLAESLNNMLMGVSALNDIGTNYQCLRLYYDALDYHLHALETTLQYDDDDISIPMLKCRATAYSGVGNVYISTGNYLKAEEMLRKALAVETQLGSHLGKNKVLAHLGKVYELRGKLDSAWVYYTASMQESELAGTKIGQAYGHLNFGRIYGLRGNYAKAIEEFQKSKHLMHSNRDLWLRVQASIALSQAYVGAGMLQDARTQLDSAQSTAEHIDAKEQLSKIDRVRAELFEREGKSQLALQLYKQAEAREDSMLNARNLFELETLQRDISDRHREEVEAASETQLQHERWTKRISLVILLIALAVLGIMIYIQRIRRRNHKALKKMMTMREHFFTNITHEFRTPLTVILGMTQELQRHEAKEVQNKAALIARHGNSLLTLINQLLDITKIRSSVGNPNWRRGNIEAHIMMIVETYREYAQHCNIDLQFSSEGAIEMNFVPDYANKVINNLLANAFKFTPEFGKIQVKVWQVQNHLHIDVTDTGYGMKPEDLEHVFEPFFQAQNGAIPLGSGVGLSLVKQIIDAVGGSITAESVLNKGTTFHVIVPIHLNESSAWADGQLENESSIGPLPLDQAPTLTDQEVEDEQLRLLVIEDNNDVAAYIGSLFEDHFAIAYASNGQEGLNKAIELVPDLIITDLMMPGMDGLEVCRRVRANEIINHIPIIVVTARVTEEERIKGIEAGADAYVAKPFSNEELRTRVDKLLARHRSLRSKFAANSTASPTEEPQLSEAERQFLSKTIDFIYLLLEKRQLEVATLAEKLCLSQRQFYRKIVAITGESPATFVLRIKMQRASVLLKTKLDMSIEDIALKTGFEHVSSFHHAFKKAYGVTPNKYRKMEMK